MPAGTSFVGINERTAILGDGVRWVVHGLGATGSAPALTATPVPPTATPAAPQPSPTAPADNEPSTYMVQRGDYLIDLARKFGVDWQGLVELNSIPYPYTIYPGQVLRLR
jgi:lipoprotein NlpD